MSESDFNGTPFVAGSVTAIRSFKVDSLGRLGSPQRNNTIFTPGVNEARCHLVGRRVRHSWADVSAAVARHIDTGKLTAVGYVDPSKTFVVGEERSNTDPGYSVEMPTSTTPLSKDEIDQAMRDINRAKARQEEERKKLAEHRPGQLDCTCGFYAYHDSGVPNIWKGDDCIEAVVEATGTVTHGEKGIRAQKLRVVAMVDPTPEPPKKPHPWRRFVGWMYDRIWAQVLVMMMTVVGGTSVILNLTTDRYHPAFTAVWLIVCLLGVVGLSTAFVKPPMRIRVAVELEKRAVARFELVKRNYPDVKVYRTRREMLAAHPLTEPAPPVVPSPDTRDDFWKMEAP